VSATHCKYCGREVVWTESKAGKKYLAQKGEIYNADGRLIKVIYPAHRCTASDSDRRDIDAQAKFDLEVRRQNGEIVKGQHVVVVKGRKVPVGTEGVVFWVATEPDEYGVIKVGFINDGGKHYTNIANLRAVGDNT